MVRRSKALRIGEKQHRKHEQQAVEKSPSGGQNDAAAISADFPGQDGIDGPDKGGEKGQQIAGRIELQGGAVQADERDAGHCGGKACKKIGSQPFLSLQEQPGQQGCEKGGDGDDDAHIGGGGQGEGHIFQKIIQTYPAEARCGKGELTLQRSMLHPAGADDEQRQKAQQETEEQDFNRLEIHKKHLGGNERSAPDKNGEKGSQMACGCFLRRNGRLTAAVFLFAGMSGTCRFFIHDRYPLLRSFSEKYPGRRREPAR